MKGFTKAQAEAIAANPWVYPGPEVVKALKFFSAEADMAAIAKDAAALHARMFSADGIPRRSAVEAGFFDGMNPVQASHFALALRRIAGVEASGKTEEGAV